ncbi:MAG: sulfotransferase domain-containing protein [Rhodovibrionaceae bacterium]
MGGLIWLASYPKSGNTWLRAFLAALLSQPGESGFDIAQLGKFNIQASHYQCYRPFTQKPPQELTPEDLAALRPRVHHYLTKARPDSVFVKTHVFLGESGGVPLITMDCTAGAIYVVRNPLDVVVSSLSYFGLDNDTAIAAIANKGRATEATDSLVIEPVSSWSVNVDSWTRNPHPALYVVRYEDMLDAPLEAFGGIANFLGVSSSQARLRAAIDATSFERLQKQEAEKGFRERSEHQQLFFRSGKRDQWKEVLSPAQIARVVEDHRETMARFGYIPEGY